MEFKDKIAKLCAEKNWSQRDLARELGEVSRSTVNNWFNGKGLPDIQQGLRLAKLFGVTLDHLSDDDAESPGLSADEAVESMEFHKKIKRLMDERGWSQVRLAEKLSVTSQRVSLWLKGTGTPRPSQFLKMAEVFDVDVRYLLSDEDEVPVRRCQPDKDESLSDDELAILVVFRTLRLTRDEAMSGLALMQLKRHAPGLVSLTGKTGESGSKLTQEADEERGRG